MNKSKKQLQNYIFVFPFQISIIINVTQKSREVRCISRKELGSIYLIVVGRNICYYSEKFEGVFTRLRSELDEEDQSVQGVGPLRKGDSNNRSRLTIGAVVFERCVSFEVEDIDDLDIV